MLIHEKEIKRLAILSCAAVLLIFATGAAVIATEAKPGDQLYSVSKKIENAQLALTFGQAQKDSLRLEIAAKRLGQIKTLLQDEDVDEALVEEVFTDLDRLLADISTQENHQEWQALNARSQRLAAKLDSIFQSHISRFEQQQIQLEQELEAALNAESERNPAVLERQINNHQQRVEHHQQVHQRIQSNLGRSQDRDDKPSSDTDTATNTPQQSEPKERGQAGVQSSNRDTGIVVPPTHSPQSDQNSLAEPDSS